jgi:hypothetical protein
MVAVCALAKAAASKTIDAAVQIVLKFMIIILLNVCGQLSEADLWVLNEAKFDTIRHDTATHPERSGGIRCVFMFSISSFFVPACGLSLARNCA